MCASRCCSPSRVVLGGAHAELRCEHHEVGACRGEATRRPRDPGVQQPGDDRGAADRDGDAQQVQRLPKAEAARLGRAHAPKAPVRDHSHQRESGDRAHDEGQDVNLRGDSAVVEDQALVAQIVSVLP